jgi:hypothetical protein
LHQSSVHLIHKKFSRYALCIGMTAWLMLALSFHVTAQKTDTAAGKTADTTSVVKKHSPQKAVILSLVCPGLGQVYNKKYWKLPFIYGAGGTLVYFISFNQLKYVKFRDAYIDYKSDPKASASGYTKIDGAYYHNSILATGRDYYRRYRDLSVFGLGALYLLNVVDAMVDAHFFNYDISDDLSMHIGPTLVEDPTLTASLGLGIKLNFK